ncbi:DUF2780 domain-containing protein [Desulfosediminicola flagellatus]|uniref:DUF2780 domain-containing protein n=1 Tax=Desulfosediminicola flagellatus TaxID=2569541 RepID=UPI0010ADA567|nr:DUF2780 domain-containing protein [Desulfosediminicola flagellatus]
MELLEMLTSQLGISDKQARGGAGLIFKLAKDKLDAGEFGQIAELVPGIDSMISGALGESAGLMSALSSLAASMGLGGKLGNLSSLAGGFKNLDLEAGMASKFVPIVLSFVQEKGGDSAKQLLEKVLT